MRRAFLCLLCAFLLAGCALPAPSVPTPWPESYLPTVIALTAAAAPTFTPPPTETDRPDLPATPTATAVPPVSTVAVESPTPGLVPSPTPSLTPEPTQPPANYASIALRAPGPESKVISPIALRAQVRPGADGRVQVELLGEDGRLLARHVLTLYPTREGGWAALRLDIPFEIRGAAERGRLQILTYDSRKRPQAALAVRLLLQSSGFNQITPGPGEDERVTLLRPEPGAAARGGVLELSGSFRPLSAQPLIIELLDEQGRPIAVRQLPGGEGAFTTTLEYRVQKATDARLVFRQSDDGPLPGPVYLYSQPIWLYP